MLVRREVVVEGGDVGDERHAAALCGGELVERGVQKRGSEPSRRRSQPARQRSSVDLPRAVHANKQRDLTGLEREGHLLPHIGASIAERDIVNFENAGPVPPFDSVHSALGRW